MRQVIYIALAVALAGVCPTAVTSRQPPGEMEPPPPPDTITYNGDRMGCVVAVTRKSVTLDMMSGVVTSDNGRPVKGERQRLMWSRELAAGGVPGLWPVTNEFGAYVIASHAKDMYRATDVRVGDTICVLCFLVNGIDTCYTVSIVRRPGGWIPPAPDENLEGIATRWHEGGNAHQWRGEVGDPHVGFIPLAEVMSAFETARKGKEWCERLSP